VQNGRVKEEIILDKVPTDNIFTFELDLKGLKPRQEKDGSITLLNKDKGVAYVIERPHMTDANILAPPEKYFSAKVSMKLEKKQGHTFILTVEADKDWLEDPKRVYPVKIDPTFAAQERPVEDTYIYEGARDTPYGTANRLYIGAYSDTKNFKTLLKYKLDTIPEGATIKEAKLMNIIADYGTDGFLTNINTGDAYYKGKTITKAYRATKDWIGSTATWTKMNADFDLVSAVDADDNSKDNPSFDVTEMVKEFKAGTKPNYGFMMDNSSKVAIIDDALPTNPAWPWTTNPVRSGVQASKITNTRSTFSWKATGNDYFIPVDSDIVAWANIQSAPSHLGFSMQNFDRWHTAYWGTEDCIIRDGLNNCEDVLFNAGGAPPAGWQKIVLSPANMDLKNKMVNGISFAALPTGEATFDDVYTYRKMVFHSSESEDGAKAPRLNVTYESSEYGRRDYKAYKEFSGASVELKDGNLMIDATDIQTAARGGVSTMVGRTYNSYDSNSQNIFGKGWSSYPNSLRVDYDGSATAILTTATGATWKFTEQADSTFKRPPGFFEDLIKTENQDNTVNFILKRKDLSIVEFDISGRAVNEIDKNGNTMTFSYGTNGMIEKIIDPNRRETTFSYLSSGKVQTITDFDSRTWSYEYNGDTLTKVTAPIGSVSYGYNPEGDLTSITNPLGGVTDITYNADKTVKSITDPVLNSTQFKYTTQDVQDYKETKNWIETSYTTVTDPKGYEYLYYFNSEGIVTVAGEPAGSTKLTNATAPSFPGAKVEREVIQEYLVFYECFEDFYDDLISEDLAWLDDWEDDWLDEVDLEPQICSRKEIDWKKENVWNKSWDPQYATKNIPPPEISQPLAHGTEVFYEYDEKDPATGKAKTYNLLKLINKDKTFTTYEYDENGNITKETNHHHDVSEDEAIYDADSTRKEARHRKSTNVYDTTRNLLLSQTSSA
ncbi:MAG TPA: RHS repeat protein, partial [Actinobacteria bacterium]|nr:RHS repeat protein [Actinomycetota bacterium]